MRIPKKLKINAITYDIVFTADEKIKDCLGKVSWRENKIYIDESLGQLQREATLLHEILHVINSNYDNKEVEFLSQAFHQIINDNKLF